MHQSLFQLPIEQPLSPYISFRRKNNLPLIVIEHPKVRAAFSLQGAQLLAWQPTGQQPLIWLSEKAFFEPQKAIRGGVPICWPWFGKTASPAHGFARLLPWQLHTHHEDEHGVALSFMLQDSAISHTFWPHRFTLFAHFKLGAECHIELESQGNYHITTALHTYFAIGDIDAVSVSGLGTSYIDEMHEGAICHQQGPVFYQGSVDRTYTAPDSVNMLHDPLLQRCIEIHHHHNSDVVTWNPGAETTKNMADMSATGYKTMVCIETAHVNQTQQVLPDTPVRLAVTLRCKPCST